MVVIFRDVAFGEGAEGLQPLDFHNPVPHVTEAGGNEVVINLDDDDPSDEKLETIETVELNVLDRLPFRNCEIEDMLSSATLSTATPSLLPDTVVPCSGKVHTKLKHSIRIQCSPVPWWSLYLTFSPHHQGLIATEAPSQFGQATFNAH